MESTQIRVLFFMFRLQAITQTNPCLPLTKLTTHKSIFTKRAASYYGAYHLIF